MPLKVGVELCIDISDIPHTAKAYQLRSKAIPKEIAMNPRQFLDSFWSPEIRNQVFIAMSFSPQMQVAYDMIIDPACSVDCGIPAFRVDLGHGGDSIITEIMDSIAHSKLVIAEVSCMNPENPKSVNGNVMWEVGIAHACRQANEVILIRRCTDPHNALFDISTIRVHSYDISSLAESRRQLALVIKDRLNSIEYEKSLLVDRAIRQLDPSSRNILLSSAKIKLKESFSIPSGSTDKEGWRHLFRLGIVEWIFNEPGRGILSEEISAISKQPDSAQPTISGAHRLTSFGQSVVKKLVKLLSRFVLSDEEIEKLVKQMSTAMQ